MHLVHLNENRNPEIVQAIHHTKGRNQVISPGNAIVEENVFNSFDTIIVHSTKDTNLMDMLKRLQPYASRLKLAMNSQTRCLAIIGNISSLIGSTVLHFPEGGKITFNNDYVSSNVIHDTPGLNLVEFNIVPYSSDANYLRNLKYASARVSKLYAKASDIVILKDNKSAGDLYSITPNLVNKLKPIELNALLGAEIQNGKPKIKPITAIYKEE